MTASILSPYLLVIALLTSVSYAQTPPPKPATYTGCVTEIPSAPGSFVLASGDRCYFIDASDATASRLRNRSVVLQGILSEAAGMAPDTIHLSNTPVLKNACTQTCTLIPPGGSRGPRGRERPGHEGATPGIKPDPTPPPPQR